MRIMHQVAIATNIQLVRVLLKYVRGSVALPVARNDSRHLARRLFGD